MPYLVFQLSSSECFLIMEPTMDSATQKQDSSRKKVPFRRSHADSAAAVFGWKPSSITQSIAASSTAIALDASTLLLPYKAAPGSIQKILSVYRILAQGGRLVIAGHAAREFAHNRSKVLGDAVKDLANIRSATPSTVTRPKNPLLSTLPEYASVEALCNKANGLLKEYQTALTQLLKSGEGLLSEDPVSEGYREIFSEEVVFDPIFDPSIIEEDLKARKAEALPPGYKDSTKADNTSGDLLIWLTLLEATRNSRRDLILATEDQKADWWIQANGRALLPRYELIDEYRISSDGGTLHLISLRNLLGYFSADESLITDLENIEFQPEVNRTYSGNSVLIEDGETLLIRGKDGLGAIRPLQQGQESPDSGNFIVYQSWYSENHHDIISGSIAPLPGRCEEGSNTVISVGAYSVPWSFCTNGSGWFYSSGYEWPGVARQDYEMAIVPKGIEPWPQFNNDALFQYSSNALIPLL